MPDLHCWIINEGHAGMENQCIGLAQALGVTYDIRRVKPRLPWRLLPPRWWPNPLAALDRPATPPWPDLVISCGRRSVAAAMAVRRASGARAIHIQDPHVPPSRFDVIIVPEHDALRAPNVIVTRGAMHHVTPEKLAQAGAHFAPRFTHLPRPLISVMVGGSNRRQDYTDAIATDLARKLAEAARASGGSIALTPSRRTDPRTVALLAEGLRDTPRYLWNREGENPYFGLLALADAIVVTSDSVSMMTEACITGKPVYLHLIPGGSNRLRRFREGLLSGGYARLFTGELPAWQPNILHETADVAADIRRRLGF